MDTAGDVGANPAKIFFSFSATADEVLTANYLGKSLDVGSSPTIPSVTVKSNLSGRVRDSFYEPRSFF